MEGGYERSLQVNLKGDVTSQRTRFNLGVGTASVGTSITTDVHADVFTSTSCTQNISSSHFPCWMNVWLRVQASSLESLNWYLLNMQVVGRILLLVHIGTFYFARSSEFLRTKSDSFRSRGPVQCAVKLPWEGRRNCWWPNYNIYIYINW
jgi:hypothetical protein